MKRSNFLVSEPFEIFDSSVLISFQGTYCHGSSPPMGSNEFMDILGYDFYSDSASPHHVSVCPIEAFYPPLSNYLHSISTIRARDLFLTTYYDPFYPDLHLYTTKPDTLHHSISSSLSRTSWSIISILDILRRDGWKALAEAMWNNLVVIVSDWQKHAWETWGADVIQENAPWPPT
jgi:hypothetical protein